MSSTTSGTASPRRRRRPSPTRSLRKSQGGSDGRGNDNSNGRLSSTMQVHGGAELGSRSPSRSPRKSRTPAMRLHGGFAAGDSSSPRRRPRADSSASTASIASASTPLAAFRLELNDRNAVGDVSPSRRSRQMQIRRKPSNGSVGGGSSGSLTPLSSRSSTTWVQRRNSSGMLMNRIAHVKEDEFDHELEEPLQNLAVAAAEEPVKRVLLKKWNEHRVEETKDTPHVAAFDLLPLTAEHVVKPRVPGSSVDDAGAVVGGAAPETRGAPGDKGHRTGGAPRGHSTRHGGAAAGGSQASSRGRPARDRITVTRRHSSHQGAGGRAGHSVLHGEADPAVEAREKAHRALRFHFEVGAKSPRHETDADPGEQAEGHGEGHTHGGVTGAVSRTLTTGKSHARLRHHPPGRLRARGSSSRVGGNNASSRNLRTAASSTSLTSPGVGSSALSASSTDLLRAARRGAKKSDSARSVEQGEQCEVEEESKVPFHLQGDPKRWETPEMLKIRRELMTHPEILRQIHRIWNALNPAQVPVLVPAARNSPPPSQSSPKKQNGRSNSNASFAASGRRTSRASRSRRQSSFGGVLGVPSAEGKGTTKGHRRASSKAGSRSGSRAAATPTSGGGGGGGAAPMLVPGMSKGKYISKDQYVQLHYLLQRTIYPNFDEMWQSGQIQLQAEHDWKQDLGRDLQKIGPQDTQGVGHRAAGILDDVDEEAADDSVLEEAIGRRLQTHMSRARFFRSMFEFVDLWTETSEVHEYVAFLRNLIRRITHLRPVFIYVAQSNDYAGLTQLLLATSISGYLQASGGGAKTWNQRYMRFKGTMLQVTSTVRMSFMANNARDAKAAAEAAAEAARLAAIQEAEEKKRRAASLEKSTSALFTATQLAGAYKMAGWNSMDDLQNHTGEDTHEKEVFNQLAQSALEKEQGRKAEEQQRALEAEAAKHDFFPDLKVDESENPNSEDPGTHSSDVDEKEKIAAGDDEGEQVSDGGENSANSSMSEFTGSSPSAPHARRDTPAARELVSMASRPASARPQFSPTLGVTLEEDREEDEEDSSLHEDVIDNDGNAPFAVTKTDSAPPLDFSRGNENGGETDDDDATLDDTAVSSQWYSSDDDEDDLFDDDDDTISDDDEDTKLFSVPDGAGVREQKRERQRLFREAMQAGKGTFAKARPFHRRKLLPFAWMSRIVALRDSLCPDGLRVATGSVAAAVSDLAKEAEVEVAGDSKSGVESPDDTVLMPDLKPAPRSALSGRRATFMQQASLSELQPQQVSQSAESPTRRVRRPAFENLVGEKLAVFDPCSELFPPAPDFGVIGDGRDDEFVFLQPVRGGGVRHRNDGANSDDQRQATSKLVLASNYLAKVIGAAAAAAAVTAAVQADADATRAKTAAAARLQAWARGRAETAPSARDVTGNGEFPTPARVLSAPASHESASGLDKKAKPDSLHLPPAPQILRTMSVKDEQRKLDLQKEATERDKARVRADTEKRRKAAEERVRKEVAAMNGTATGEQHINEVSSVANAKADSAISHHKPSNSVSSWDREGDDNPEFDGTPQRLQELRSKPTSPRVPTSVNMPVAPEPHSATSKKPITGKSGYVPGTVMRQVGRTLNFRARAAKEAVEVRKQVEHRLKVERRERKARRLERKHAWKLRGQQDPRIKAEAQREKRRHAHIAALAHETARHAPMLALAAAPSQRYVHVHSAEAGGRGDCEHCQALLKQQMDFHAAVQRQRDKAQQRRELIGQFQLSRASAQLDSMERASALRQLLNGDNPRATDPPAIQALVLDLDGAKAAEATRVKGIVPQVRGAVLTSDSEAKVSQGGELTRSSTSPSLREAMLTKFGRPRQPAKRPTTSPTHRTKGRRAHRKSSAESQPGRSEDWEVLIVGQPAAVEAVGSRPTSPNDDFLGKGPAPVRIDGQSDALRSSDDVDIGTRSSRVSRRRSSSDTAVNANTNASSAGSSSNNNSNNNDNNNANGNSNACDGNEGPGSERQEIDDASFHRAGSASINASGKASWADDQMEFYLQQAGSAGRDDLSPDRGIDSTIRTTPRSRPSTSPTHRSKPANPALQRYQPRHRGRYRPTTTLPRAPGTEVRPESAPQRLVWRKSNKGSNGRSRVQSNASTIPVRHECMESPAVDTRRESAHGKKYESRPPSNRNPVLRSKVSDRSQNRNTSGFPLNLSRRRVTSATRQHTAQASEQGNRNELEAMVQSVGNGRPTSGAETRRKALRQPGGLW